MRRLAAFLIAGLAWFSAALPAAALPPALKTAPIGIIQGVKPPLAVENLAATRARPAQQITASQDQMLCRSYHVATEDNIKRLKVAFANFYISQGEKGSGAAATVRAYIEFPIGGTLIPLTFRGGPVGDMASLGTGSGNTTVDATVTSDYAPVQMKKGDAFLIRHLFTNTSGIFSIAGSLQTATIDFGGGPGADMRQQAATTWGDAELRQSVWSSLGTGGFPASCFPLAIVTDRGVNPSFLFLGDSVTIGQNDTTQADGRQGVTGHLLPANDVYAAVNLGQGAVTAAQYSSQSVGRSNLWGWVNNVVVQTGTNDNLAATPTALAAATTLLTSNQALVTNAQAVTRRTFRPDAKTWLTTLAVEATDSGSAWALTSTQTPTSSFVEALYDSIITTAKPAGYKGVIDFNALIAEASPARTVTDGSISAGSPTLTSASAAWSAGDVNNYVEVLGAGPSGYPLRAKINSFSGNNATLNTNAYTTVLSGATVKIDVGKVRPRAGARTATCTTAGTTSFVMTSPDANFTSADRYSGIFIVGSGGFVIDTITNSTTVNMRGKPVTSVSNAVCYLGGRNADFVHPNAGGYLDSEGLISLQPFSRP